jgi:peroxiredoxin
MVVFLRAIGSCTPLLVIVAVASGCSPAAVSPAGSSVGGTVKAGTLAGDFTARDIEGRTVRLSDYLGKQAVLLDFWSTFCQPCVAEMAHLRRIYDENKAKGFVVIAISMDGPETISDVPSFAKRNGMKFPVVVDEDSRIASVYNPRKSAPLSVLIDRTGKIAVVREGYNPGDEDFIAKDVAAAVDISPASN